jgi:hypothetical protein
VYPPSLELSSEEIRTEFVSALVRSRDKSLKDAVVSSTLLPIAATLDASLLFTLGGLTGSTAAVAYTSSRGVKTSNEITKGISLSEGLAAREVEGQGCTCGHHTADFGPFQVTTKKDKDKCKKNKETLNLRLQPSTGIDVLERYLYLACLDKDFSMFPSRSFSEKSGTVDEEAVLRAIGWKPTTRSGRDLEIEIAKGKTEVLSVEQDEVLQVREARDDVRRVFRKGAAEWIASCKAWTKEGKEGGKESKERSKESKDGKKDKEVKKK